MKNKSGIAPTLTSEGADAKPNCWMLAGSEKPLRERRKSIGVYCVQRLYQVTTIIIHDPGIYPTRDGIERQDIMMLIGIDVPGRKQKL